MERRREILEHERPIEIEDLERCLTRYGDETSDDGSPVYRAVTMNVLAVAPAADESLLRATFRRLLGSSPCVAFLILLTDSDQPIDARFATYCEESSNGRTVLLEQVTLHVGPSDRSKLASLLLPLLVQDLPTIAFWAGGLPSDLSLVQELGGLAERLIYDSSLFEDPDADCRRLESLGIPTQDLTWLRLEPWRRALAEAFEHVEWPPVTAVRATIHHADARGTRAGTARLAHWLEERLGADVRTEVELRQHAPSFEPCQVRLTFDDCEIVVQHRWPVANLKTDITLEDRCIVPFTTTARSDSRGDLLARAASMVEEHVRR